MPKPTRIVHRPRDVPREVSQLHPTGFEGYVADRFSNLPGWRAETTPRSRDQGADVLITSPRGVRYLVQCKLVTSSLGSPEAQRTGGAASFYGVLVSNAILLSALPSGTCDTAFTAEARRYANITGLKLWTLEALQRVAEAEASGSDAGLGGLGLDITPPVASMPTPPTRGANAGRTLFTGLFAGVVLLLGAGFMASAELPRVALETVSIEVPVGDEAAVRAHLAEWASAFPTAARTNDAELAAQFNAGAELEALRRVFADRRGRGCWLEVGTPDFVVESVIFNGADAATATVVDGSSVGRICGNGTGSAGPARRVQVTYRLVLGEAGWRIVSSTTRQI